MKIQVKLNDEQNTYTIYEFSGLPTGTLGLVINSESEHYGKIVINDRHYDRIVLIDHINDWWAPACHESKVKMFRKLSPEESVTISNNS